MFWALEGCCALAPLSDVSVDDFSYTLKEEQLFGGRRQTSCSRRGLLQRLTLKAQVIWRTESYMHGP